MKLTYEGLRETEKWRQAGIALPSYDPAAAAKRAKDAPVWAHFGVGNIFRVFIGGLADRLLNEGAMDRGIVCVEAYDFEIADKIYAPFDNLVLSVTLRGDGTTEKRVLGSLSEAVKATPDDPAAMARLQAIFSAPSLQMVSFTVTEKAYALRDASGAYLPRAARDMEKGPAAAAGAIGMVTALLYERFRSGGTPLALVSMDNVSRNGEKLRAAVLETAEEWRRRGFVPDGFAEWIGNEGKVSFPWTMIDKITPRPGPAVAELLTDLGVEDMTPVITEKQTYIAPYGNAEGPQYLVIEDRFPNGRPPLERAGVYMTDRATVNKAERMKVTACLNPIHTGLCTYACLLGYELFADAMGDPELSRLARVIGYGEGLPVVDDPGVLSPEAFLDEVLNERFPNPYLGDTSARIAVDISQMTAIRFGETIKAHMARGDSAGLTGIPLAIAGWFRYLLAVDDRGEPFALSPDPMLPELREIFKGVILGRPETLGDRLRGLLTNETLFGVDLYDAGIGEKIEAMTRELLAGPGAVRATLKRHLVSL
ncbi:MAG: mannitol dehydrogenase family protein [Clostridia bacterium]|nr:mannitol dehydrogenase family protein [Clostridia bacterium]